MQKVEREKNIYQIARESSGLTQLRAAGLLNVSNETLCAYENNKRTVPDDIVARMSELYDLKLLCYQHLKQKETAQMLPHIEEKTLCQSAVNFIKTVREAEANTDILLKLATDNRISAEEEELWEKFLEKVDALEEACLTIKFCKEK